jgi:hypothetical protein
MQGSFNAGAADAQAKTGEPEDGAGNAAVHVTFFKDYAAQRYTTEKLTLPQLQERVLNASARAKDKLPWLKLATFGSNRTGKGSLRHDANVLDINGIELDYDDEKIAFNDAAKVLSEMDISALIYTSPSHSPAAALANCFADLQAAAARHPRQVGRAGQWLPEGQAGRREGCRERKFRAQSGLLLRLGNEQAGARSSG